MARRSSSRREARKAASVGSGCKEIASTSACAAGERKECGDVGVWCDRRGVGVGAVRWSRSESSGTEERLLAREENYEREGAEVARADRADGMRHTQYG
ncbi:hypothetical protein Zm00014a_001360 [Zea mays]|uniref:Uncharacterized protein n=1 Tax=Zea mays TaxID=4577 RepID=A0A3L6DVX5_MAIZE|nr:hypothetical protein Zm00014a_001360 [Zea mays]